jgi:osmotically-inducible protein OsmY
MPPAREKPKFLHAFNRCKDAIMKTDSVLKTDVMDELQWDPAIDPATIETRVTDGVVTLSGRVASFMQKVAVEHVVRRIGGVRAIVLDVDVNLPPESCRTDEQIAQQVYGILAWSTVVALEDVGLKVRGGWVYLTGEVDWDYQRRALETQLRPLAGIVGISNEIVLRHRVTPADLAARIHGALQRQAHREASRIDIKVDASTVTLRGVVHSWQERDAVVGAAWAAPGVRVVVDEVEIGSGPVQ